MTSTDRSRPLLEGTPYLPDWLEMTGCAVAFSTYEAHRLWFVNTLAPGECTESGADRRT